MLLGKQAINVGCNKDESHNGALKTTQGQVCPIGFVIDLLHKILLVGTEKRAHGGCHVKYNVVDV
jgi:hypothetical protein